jgi:hypothetical protein
MAYDLILKGGDVDNSFVYSVSTSSSLTSAICSRPVDRFYGGQHCPVIYPRHKRQGF